MKLYSNGVVYKIENDVNDIVYIGSTVSNLKIRKRNHIQKLKTHVHLPLYADINRIGFEHFKFCELEKFNNITMKELHEHEQKHHLNYKNTYNCMYAAIREKAKIERKKIYNKPTGIQLEKLKKYHDGYNKNYYIKNNEKLKQKCNCECGGKYVYINKSKHLKSKKHQTFVK